MPAFGRASNRRKSTLHPLLQVILEEAIKDCPLDFTIVWGHRNEEEQNYAYSLGNSTKKWPESKHNQLPSMAVDIAPWPIVWEEVDEFGFVAGYINRVAIEMGARLRWGGTWRMNDVGHLELLL